MKLEALTLEIRPRTPWEAMDLAVRLVMTHWRILAGSWMLTVFPIFVIINLLLLEDYPLWAFAIVWLLKPLYDRIPLFVLSRLIFAQQTSYADVLNALPALLKTGVLASLTLYRLDPGRSFSLPVRQLEGLTGKRRRERINTLHRSNNREVLFFILCFHLETLISWGLIGLLLMMLPENMALQGAEEIFLNEEPELLINILSMTMYFVTMMLVETLYVAGGFVLYLNRRTILEGWDIELVFKKLTQRYELSKAQLQSLLVLFSIPVIFLFFTLSTPAAYAVSHNASTVYEAILPEINQAPLAADASREMIKEVMQHPVFNRYKQVETFEYTGNDKQDENSQRDYVWLTDLMEFIGSILAYIFEAGLWILAVIAVLLLVKYRHRLHLGYSYKVRHVNKKPETLFGLDVREESLPDNITQQVLQLYQQQQYRVAMALLYRATLAHLVQNYHFELKKGATEGDCMILVTEELALLSQEEGQFFVDLTQAWQLTAYAHRIVSLEKMQQLCHSWSLLYDAADSDKDKAD